MNQISRLPLCRTNLDLVYANMEAKSLLWAWRGQNVRKRVRKTGKVMQADFAEEGLIDLSDAAKGGNAEETACWKGQKRAYERAKSRIKGSGIIKLEPTKIS